MTSEHNEVKLLPCPFCGDKDVSLCVQRVNDKTTIRSVRCSGCDAEGPYDYEDEPAVHAWNTRPTDEVEKLREALGDLQLAAGRVANKYGRDPETDELLDWTEWQNVRDSVSHARALLTEKANG